MIFKRPEVIAALLKSGLSPLAAELFYEMQTSGGQAEVLGMNHKTGRGKQVKNTGLPRWMFPFAVLDELDRRGLTEVFADDNGQVIAMLDEEEATPFLWRALEAAQRPNIPTHVIIYDSAAYRYRVVCTYGTTDVECWTFDSAFYNSPQGGWKTRKELEWFFKDQHNKKLVQDENNKSVFYIRDL